MSEETREIKQKTLDGRIIEQLKPLKRCKECGKRVNCQTLNNLEEGVSLGLCCICFLKYCTEIPLKEYQRHPELFCENCFRKMEERSGPKKKTRSYQSLTVSFLKEIFEKLNFYRDQGKHFQQLEQQLAKRFCVKGFVSFVDLSKKVYPEIIILTDLKTKDEIQVISLTSEITFRKTIEKAIEIGFCYPVYSKRFDEWILFLDKDISKIQLRLLTVEEREKLTRGENEE